MALNYFDASVLLMCSIDGIAISQLGDIHSILDLDPFSRSNWQFTWMSVNEPNVELAVALASAVFPSLRILTSSILPLQNQGIFGALKHKSNSGFPSLYSQAHWITVM